MIPTMILRCLRVRLDFKSGVSYAEREVQL